MKNLGCPYIYEPWALLYIHSASYHSASFIRRVFYSASFVFGELPFGEFSFGEFCIRRVCIRRVGIRRDIFGEFSFGEFFSASSPFPFQQVPQSKLIRSVRFDVGGPCRSAYVHACVCVESALFRVERSDKTLEIPKNKQFKYSDRCGHLS